MMFGRVMVGLCLAVILGCASYPAHSVETQVGAAAAAVPPNQASYPLGPDDLIEISVWKEPELTKQMAIRPDGKISYPLIGEIQAAGLTVKQLQTEIHRRLEKFVSDATVTVILLKPHSYKIYVTGRVAKPGEFLVGRPLNVIQAIALAGGLTPFASPGSIVVLRNVGGKEEVFHFNYKAVSKGEFLEQNRILLPGDVVVVP